MGPMAKNKFHDGPGPSQRQLRVGELIRRTLADVLARGDVHDPDLNRMSITVGEVSTTPGHKIATAEVHPHGGAGPGAGHTHKGRPPGERRRAGSKKLTLKFAPDLRFQLDETFDRMDDTRRLFAQDVVRDDVEREDDVHRDAQD